VLSKIAILVLAVLALTLPSGTGRAEQRSTTGSPAAEQYMRAAPSSRSTTDFDAAVQGAVPSSRTRGLGTAHPRPGDPDPNDSGGPQNRPTAVPTR
jgi:hypothetical protein